MSDELDLLNELPRHPPSEALRRDVRRQALARFEAASRPPWWSSLLDQAAIPLALATASVVYLVWAAQHTPLLR